MKINQIIWIQKFVNKINDKHQVTTDEVEEVLSGSIKIRRVGKGDVEGEDLYSTVP